MLVLKSLPNPCPGTAWTWVTGRWRNAKYLRFWSTLHPWECLESKTFPRHHYCLSRGLKMSVKWSSSQEANLGTSALGSNFPSKFPLDVFRPRLTMLPLFALSLRLSQLSRLDVLNWHAALLSFCCSIYLLIAVYSSAFLCFILHKFIHSKQKYSCHGLSSRPYRTYPSVTYTAWKEGAWMHWVLAMKAQYTQFCEEDVFPFYK